MRVAFFGGSLKQTRTSLSCCPKAGSSWARKKAKEFSLCAVDLAAAIAEQTLEVGKGGRQIYIGLRSNMRLSKILFKCFLIT